ncbi:gamma-glutamyltransferase [Tautonia plasticadhaerens]|uniref:Glutathione hydrolase proenzyme n=1 Tax=Tautonia plasticadhaerens TaxID=2527974 RepID=A0A518H4Z2_9BACT|nr:gamma-glutamyltransferase [Tautonia plasticadhaerens]QDV35916.1 Gamma-glutamyltranspeptidase precursor [Tautonia plasticadhaerens]
MPPWFAPSVALLAVATGPSSAEEFATYAVVSQESHASDVGREVLRKGGNAIDSAVATAFALAVTHPAAGNIGGGGFIVAFVADRGEVVTYDFRERAPRAATERTYLSPEGRLLPRYRAGLWAGGVPGTVRGLALAHEQLGTLDWAELVRPAVDLAERGFPVSDTLARSLNAQLFVDDGAADLLDGSGRGARLADFPASVAAFRKPDGTPWVEGDVLRQPDLAATLSRVAEDGPDAFYAGEIADRIAEAMRAGGGLISEEDLESYEAVRRAPVHGTFRGFDVFGMGPPSSGGIVTVLMLNLLERFDLAADGPEDPETLHRITEAMRRAFFVRATEIADPDFVDVPVDELTSKDFADELAGSIGPIATPSEDLADFPIAGLVAEGTDTTHLSVLDGDGNAVALTYTLEQGYGSKAVVPGLGFLLNNEMGDFNLVPGVTSTSGLIGTRPNVIAPGKRMLSSMSPTIVLEDGKVRLVTGSPGGRTIPNTVLWVVLNVLEFGRSPREAVDAPRSHHSWFPDRLTLEGDSWPEAAIQGLRDRGHRVRSTPLQGDAHSIVVDPGTGIIHGVNDRRRSTSKASGG